MRALLMVSALFAVTLAGCTGNFDVQQTEPIRVQLEGPAETVAVREADPEPQKVIVETCPESSSCDVERIDIELVIQSDDQASRILIVIEDEDGQRLAEREVVLGNASTNSSTSTSATSSSSDTTTATNSSSSSSTSSSNSTTPAPTQTVVQNIVLDVKGKDNIVVLTQALQGSAEVLVAAQEAAVLDAPQGNATSTPPTP